MLLNKSSLKPLLYDSRNIGEMSCENTLCALKWQCSFRNSFVPNVGPRKLGFCNLGFDHIIKWPHHLFWSFWQVYCHRFGIFSGSGITEQTFQRYSNFFSKTNTEFLYECNSEQLPTFFSSKLEFPVIKTLEIHSLNVKKSLSNLLITGKSNFDEKKVVIVAFVKKLLLTELGLQLILKPGTKFLFC